MKFMWRHWSQDAHFYGVQGGRGARQWFVGFAVQARR